MDLDTGLLRAFLAVGRTGNVTQAAAELFVSQPALSGRISRLERAVGAHLFQRHQGGVRLTDAGRAFEPYAEQVLVALDRGVGDAVSATSHGVLRVDVLDAGLAVPRRAVERLRTALPDVELEVSERGSVDQERRLRSGELDLALGTAGPPQVGVAQRRLASEPLGVAVPAADPRAGSEGLGVADLRDDVHYVPSAAFAPEWVELIHAALGGAPSATVPLHTESTRTPLELVAAGRCVAISLASTPAPHGVVVVPLADAPAHVWVARHLDSGPRRAVAEKALRAIAGLDTRLSSAMMNPVEEQEGPRTEEGDAKVVTLCGSTRFEEEFAEVSRRLTMDGCVVLSLGMFSLPDLPGYDWAVDSAGLKARLGGLHFQKIRMADEVFIVDPGGYVGESTRREIAYAESLGKPVRYLSREVGP